MDKKTVLITDMDLRGRGIGKVDGKAVFIPGAVLGDTVEYTTTVSEKRYEIGELSNILSCSKRITPICDGAEKCGGCAFMNIPREDELDIKRRAVESAFRRSGIKDVSVSKIISGKAQKYRNKAVFHLGDDGKYGFFNNGTNELYHPDCCVLMPDICMEIIKHTENFLCGNKAVKAPKSIMLRIGKENVMIASEVGNFCDSHPLLCELTEEFPEISSAFECIGHPTDIKTKFRCAFGENHIITKFNGISLSISPRSFFQVNTEIAELFCREIVKKLAPAKEDLILDLYCGIGTIGLSIAKAFPDAKLLGIEINDSAVADARKNCKLAKIFNAEFICSDAGRADYAGLSPYALIVDPPRFGLSDSMIKNILNISPKILVYMSCDPGTLAGNATKLTDRGYKIMECIAGDMFPFSPHVESLCFFEKNG